jgi:hypothetical protein
LANATQLSKFSISSKASLLFSTKSRPDWSSLYGRFLRAVANSPSRLCG